jgi:hypothetical protein
MAEHTRPEQAKPDPSSAQAQPKREEPLQRVLEDLARRGYTEHFQAVDDGLKALGSGERFARGDLMIRGYYRFEGTSDPDDAAIAYAIETRSGVRGILVDAYGVYSDPTTTAVLKDVPIVGKSAA